MLSYALVEAIMKFNTTCNFNENKRDPRNIKTNIIRFVHSICHKKEKGFHPWYRSGNKNCSSVHRGKISKEKKKEKRNWTQLNVTNIRS